MKKLEQLMDDRDSLISAAEELSSRLNTEPDATTRKQSRLEIKKMQRRVRYLNVIIAYMESGPTEEFCKRELKRVEAEIQAVNSRFFLKYPQGNHKFATLDAEKIARRDFEKEYGIKKKKEQIKNLRFILK